MTKEEIEEFMQEQYTFLKEAAAESCNIIPPKEINNIKSLEELKKKHDLSLKNLEENNCYSTKEIEKLRNQSNNNLEKLKKLIKTIKNG